MEKPTKVRVIRTIEYLYDIEDESFKGLEVGSIEFIEAADKKAVDDFYKDIEEGNEMYASQEVVVE
jgi:hypothetical protein